MVLRTVAAWSELDAQQLFGDLEVAAARNGQKFGDALHDAEQDGL